MLGEFGVIGVCPGWLGGKAVNGPGRSARGRYLSLGALSSFFYLCFPPGGVVVCEILHTRAVKVARQDQKPVASLPIRGQAPRSQVVCAFQAAL
jgi:hypothetical protein